VRVFFDTNILVYLFDRHAHEKWRRAQDLFLTHSVDGSLLLSTQVLQEFYVTVTRKLSAPLGGPEALEAVRLFASFPMTQVDAELIVRGAERSQREMFSFWDGLILEAALAGGATRLLSEDMQHGREVSGMVIENPFLRAA
jgi:predicted nucleic acid-binding protein